MQTKPLLLIALSLLILPTAFSQTSLSIIPSEAELLAHSTANCENFNCSDEHASLTRTDIFTTIRDGSTTTLERVQNLATRQAISVAYDLPEGAIRQGTYYLRLYFQDTGTYNFLIIPYSNQTHINTAKQKYLSQTISTQDWYDIDISNLLNYSVNSFGGGRVKLRFALASNTSSNIMDVGEAYLVQPPTRENFQVLPQGVSETALNSYVVNEWKILSLATPVVSSYGCELTNSSDLSSQLIPPLQTTYDTPNQILRTTWYSNSSIFLERKNYEVSCFMVATGINITDIKQFVYMNADKSILDYILLFVQKIAQIIGLLEQNQGLLNQSLQNQNQTRIQITNLSIQMNAINQSLNTQIVATRQNLSDQLNELVFAEAYS